MCSSRGLGGACGAVGAWSDDIVGTRSIVWSKNKGVCNIVDGEVGDAFGSMEGDTTAAGDMDGDGKSMHEIDGIKRDALMVSIERS